MKYSMNLPMKYANLLLAVAGAAALVAGAALTEPPGKQGAVQASASARPAAPDDGGTCGTCLNTP